MPNAATLAIDLSALRANFRLLRARHAKQTVAAVVKADGYGLGMGPIARALWQEGCRLFFVATLDEGISLRAVLPDAEIGVFNGLFAGEEKEYGHHRLTPVLNDIGQAERFVPMEGNDGMQAILHVDTGMTRLGLDAIDLERLPFRHPSSIIRYLISHLACAGDPAHPKNAQQLARFREARALFPGVPASLCNSAGLFLSPDFHFDLARPGCALYGINPTEGPNPMRPVVTLSAPVLQLRTLERDETVGYDAAYAAKAGDRIAIAGLGYADGWLRALGGKGFAYIQGHKVPIVGRVSMDMLALDVTALPESALDARCRAEFINGIQTVDDVAAAAGTIGYEIFTRLGVRLRREYHGDRNSFPLSPLDA